MGPRWCLVPFFNELEEVWAGSNVGTNGRENSLIIMIGDHIEKRMKYSISK